MPAASDSTITWKASTSLPRAEDPDARSVPHGVPAAQGVGEVVLLDLLAVADGPDARDAGRARAPARAAGRRAKAPRAVTGTALRSRPGTRRAAWPVQEGVEVSGERVGDDAGRAERVGREAGGQRDAGHAGGPRRGHARRRVLERHARGRLRADPRGRREEDVRVRLAARHLVAAHDDGQPLARPVSASVWSTFSAGPEVATANGTPRPLEEGEEPLQAGRGPKAPARQLAIEALLLLRERAQVLARQRAAEQLREDVGVALAVEPRPRPLVECGQPVAVGEGGEGPRVQRHVVHQRAVEVEHDAAHVASGQNGRSPRSARPLRKCESCASGASRAWRNRAAASARGRAPAAPGLVRRAGAGGAARLLRDPLGLRQLGSSLRRQSASSARRAGADGQVGPGHGAEAAARLRRLLPVRARRRRVAGQRGDLPRRVLHARRRPRRRPGRPS